MAASPVMVGLWALASVLRPGYDQLTQNGSELGTGPNSLVMNTNFVVTGLLIVIFCFGLLKNIDAGIWSRVGLTFLAIAGAGEVATGIFPCDPGCPLTGSPSQLIHTGIAVVFFGSVAVFPLLVGIASNWTRKYRALHCIFYGCPNFIPVRWTLAKALSCPPVSMDMDNCGASSTSRKSLRSDSCGSGSS